MDCFPLTVSGKLDKQALPDAEFNTNENYVAPTSEAEAMLCKIWQEVLGLPQVGVTDNFFRIGGNSILAIQVSHRMNETLKYKLKVADLFKYPEITELLSNYNENIEYNEGRI
jgi:hypothetical protein